MTGSKIDKSSVPAATAAATAAATDAAAAASDAAAAASDAAAQARTIADDLEVNRRESAARAAVVNARTHSSTSSHVDDLPVYNVTLNTLQGNSSVLDSPAVTRASAAAAAATVARAATSSAHPAVSNTGSVYIRTMAIVRSLVAAALKSASDASDSIPPPPESEDPSDVPYSVAREEAIQAADDAVAAAKAAGAAAAQFTDPRASDQVILKAAEDVRAAATAAAAAAAKAAAAKAVALEAEVAAGIARNAASSSVSARSLAASVASSTFTPPPDTTIEAQVAASRAAGYPSDESRSTLTTDEEPLLVNNVTLDTTQGNSPVSGSSVASRDSDAAVAAQVAATVAAAQVTDPGASDRAVVDAVIAAAQVVHSDVNAVPFSLTPSVDGYADNHPATPTSNKQVTEVDISLDSSSDGSDTPSLEESSSNESRAIIENCVDPNPDLDLELASYLHFITSGTESPSGAGATNVTDLALVSVNARNVADKADKISLTAGGDDATTLRNFSAAARAAADLVDDVAAVSSSALNAENKALLVAITGIVARIANSAAFAANKLSDQLLGTLQTKEREAIDDLVEKDRIAAIAADELVNKIKGLADRAEANVTEGDVSKPWRKLADIFDIIAKISTKISEEKSNKVTGLADHSSDIKPIPSPISVTAAADDGWRGEYSDVDSELGEDESGINYASSQSIEVRAPLASDAAARAAERINTSNKPPANAVKPEPVNESHSNFIYKPCELVITEILRSEKGSATQTTAINTGGSDTTAEHGEQFKFEFATPLKKDQVRCFTLRSADSADNNFSLGRFIYDQKSEKSSKTSGDPGKYQITEFPKIKASSGDLTQEQEKVLVRAKVEFAVKMAMQIIAGKTPSKENPITLTGTNPEELRYLWTALVKLGKELPMRFDASAIQVNSSRFNPDEEKGRVYGYSSKSLFNTAFQENPGPIKQAVQDATQLISAAKKAPVTAAGTSPPNDKDRHLFNSYKAKFKTEVVTPRTSTSSNTAQSNSVAAVPLSTPTGEVFPNPFYHPSKPRK